MKITDESKRQLRQDAKAELERLEKLIDSEDTIQLLDKYKNKFNLCETTYKIVLKEHQLTTKGKIKGQLKLLMTQAPFAMEFAGYEIDRELLNRLFGSKCDEGTTAKKLRDAITHGLNEKAIEEIKRRKEPLFKDMDDFLSIIRNA